MDGGMNLKTVNKTKKEKIGIKLTEEGPKYEH